MNVREGLAWVLVVALGAPGVVGDADGNGVVNFDDNNAVLAHWGESGPAWAEHVCPPDAEVVGPPEPSEVERWLARAKVYTNGDSNGGEGWQVGGADNRVVIDAPGEVEEWIARTGARQGAVRFVSSLPDWSEAVGGEE